MDRLSKQLKDDAAAIDVAVDDALQKRLDASLAAATTAPAPRPAAHPTRRWLRFAALATIAAASAATVLLTARTPETPAPASATLPVTVAADRPLPLNIQPAQLTDPLNDEMQNLGTDWQKVRARVESDLGFRL